MIFREKLATLPVKVWLPLLLIAAFVAGLLVAGPGDQRHEPRSDEAAHEDASSAATIWTCSMHPQIRQPDKGQCPICGMDLIPVSGGDSGSDLLPEQIKLSARAQTLAQLRTQPVQRLNDQALSGLRLLGRVDYDETRMRTVTTWTQGRIDKLHVASTGQRVARGQVIATVYSPEIYAAHQDLMQAAAQLQKMQQATPNAQAAAKRGLDSAQQRLRLLGVPDSEIQSMQTADKPWRQVSIRSPFGGTVIERLADEGSYVQAGSGIYRIADLSRVWLQLDAYEADLARIEKGQTVTLTTDALPDETFSGTVAFIDPVIDLRRRTARVRVEVSNSDGKLRPGMFATASVHAQHAGERDASGHAEHRHRPLVIADTAPLFAGRRSLVYVELPQPGADGARVYEAREVRLAPKRGDLFPVVSGLREGERVVVYGAFVIDADLQIRGGKSLMSLTDDLHRPDASDPIEMPVAAEQQVAKVITAYLELQKRFAADDFPGAQRAATALRKVAEQPVQSASKPFEQAYAKLRRRVAEQSAALAQAPDIATARRLFEPVSLAVIGIVERFGNPVGGKVHLAWCPMAIDNRGALWLQDEAEIRNPYHGSAMLTCGELHADVAHGDRLSTTHGSAMPNNVEATPAAAPAGAAHGHQH